jgi:predicted dehydrogenase
MNRITRRTFIKASAAAGISTLVPFSRARSANDDLRLAVIGLNNQGANHVGWFREIPGVRIAALCEVDGDVLGREMKKFDERNEKVETFTDVRKLLDNKDIDAVVVATPDHWHALMMIWACQAGKDVYCEKPVAYSIWEGRQMIQAARKYGRIVQSGIQRRSDEGIREAVGYLQSGALGAIRSVTGIVYTRRDSIGKVDGPQPIPSTVDFDLWTGPAPMGPLMRKKLHYDWHWVWPTGNGDFGNNGIHYIDICRWVLGQNKLPAKVMSMGGRFGYVDDGQTPNTQVVYLDYQPVPILFEVRGLPRATGDKAMDVYRGIQGGLVVQCENGYFAGGDGGWAYDNSGKKIRQFVGSGGGKEHHANFIQAIRSRKASDLAADIREGHLSSALCHMGNVSYRMGAELRRDAVLETIKGRKDLADSFARLDEHLKRNGVDLEQSGGALGPWLQLDPESESFVGDFREKANALATREYRKPFIVPEQG